MVPQNLLLASFVVFIFGGEDVDDLAKMAIVFIYPNGRLEKIPITHYKYHIDYLKNHLNDSKEYAAIVRGLTFMDPRHKREDDRFMMNGLVVLYNLNVWDIVENPELLNDNIPSFSVLLPDSMGSLEQINNLVRILTSYDSDSLFISHFNLTLDDYEDFEYGKTLDYLNEARTQFNEPRM